VSELSDVQHRALAAEKCERLVWGAHSVGGRARMIGEPDAFEELFDAVAAEANHEHDADRRQRYDLIGDHLEHVVEQ
jgi:hypothetical protein